MTISEIQRSDVHLVTVTSTQDFETIDFHMNIKFTLYLSCEHRLYQHRTLLFQVAHVVPSVQIQGTATVPWLMWKTHEETFKAYLRYFTYRAHSSTL